MMNFKEFKAKRNDELSVLVEQLCSDEAWPLGHSETMAFLEGAEFDDSDKVFRSNDPFITVNRNWSLTTRWNNFNGFFDHGTCEWVYELT